MRYLRNKRNWLPHGTLILFLLTASVISCAAEYTYAGRNESPDHILTYDGGKLVWDSDSYVNQQSGAAEFSLFQCMYQNVQSEDGEKIIAPGTEGKNNICLKNDAGHSVKYIAVMYSVKKQDILPVEPVMTEDEAFTDTGDYPLPEGVNKDQVVKAVTGTVGKNSMQDFEIAWLWKYSESDGRDQADTFLGNHAAWVKPDEVLTGLYIVVAEETYVYPQVPQTGVLSSYPLYLVLAGSSLLITVLLIKERRKNI